MKYNLLKMTQLILSSMDSDQVNDIADTDESLQVVDIIEQTYNDIASTIDFPDMWDFFELTSASDSATPTLMYIPDDSARIEWIRYDNSLSGDTERKFYPVLPLDREVFFDRMNNLDTADTNIYQFNLTVGAETFDVRGRNDIMPTYYTVIDNRTILFDNYDSSEDSTITANKTQCYGMKIPVFTRSNDFIPQFEPRQFTLFFNEAKSQCFIELKQIQNAKADQRARRGWIHSQRKKQNTNVSDIHNVWTPDYGRRRTK